MRRSAKMAAVHHARSSHHARFRHYRLRHDLALSRQGDRRRSRGQVRRLFRPGPAAADKLAAETGCTAYHALDDMLADPRVAVVTIGTPSGAHAEPAVAAARAGKHVIVEKPLEITLRRCDAIIEACQKAGVVLSTIFPSRFHDTARLLKRAVDAGRFGRLTLADACVKWYRSQAYYDSGAWRGTWDLDGGGALDEPGHPQRRSAPLADGPRGRGPREDGLAGPRADRCRGRGSGHARVRQRSDWA